MADFCKTKKNWNTRPRGGGVLRELGGGVGLGVGMLKEWVVGDTAMHNTKAVHESFGCTFPHSDTSYILWRKLKRRRSPFFWNNLVLNELN